VDDELRLRVQMLEEGQTALAQSLQELLRIVQGITAELTSILQGLSGQAFGAALLEVPLSPDLLKPLMDRLNGLEESIKKLTASPPQDDTA